MFGNDIPNLNNLVVGLPIPNLINNSLSTNNNNNNNNNIANVINLNKGDEKEMNKIVDHLINLRNADKREESLQELSKMRENFPDLALLLWHSTGAIAILI